MFPRIVRIYLNIHLGNLRASLTLVQVLAGKNQNKYGNFKEKIERKRIFLYVRMYFCMICIISSTTNTRPTNIELSEQIVCCCAARNL